MSTARGRCRVGGGGLCFDPNIFLRKRNALTATRAPAAGPVSLRPAVSAFNGAASAEGATYLSGTSGNVALVTGTYVASTGVFTAGTGPDLLFEYDTNGAAAGGTEAVVLVGSNGAISSYSSDGAGVFTFA